MDDKIKEAQIKAISKVIDSQFSEFFDAYVVIGVIAGTNDAPIIIDRTHSPLLAHALNNVMHSTDLANGEDEEED